MYTQSPVASDGFILNYADLLLILCKPFTGVFSKFPNFLSKINPFYLMTNKFVPGARDRIDKIERRPEQLRHIYNYLD